MISNPHLERIIAKETYSEMLAQLRPRELAVVAIRLDEVPFDITGEILGLTRQAVYQRMYHARHRMMVLFPHIKPLVSE